MRQLRTVFWSGAFVSLLALGCDRERNSLTSPPLTPGNPSGPGVTPTPTPPTTSSWTIDIATETITGDACAMLGLASTYIPSPGAPWNILRTGSSIEFIYLPANYPTDSTEYTGTVTGSSFVASRTEVFPPQSWTCEGGRIVRDPQQIEQVSGNFSADGRHLEGVEIETWRLGSGEQATARRHWSGTRS